MHCTRRPDAPSCEIVPSYIVPVKPFVVVSDNTERSAAEKATCSAISFQDSSNSVKGSPPVPVVACDEDFRTQSSRAQNHEMRCHDVAAFDDTCRECANRFDCRRTYRFHSSLDPEHHPRRRSRTSVLSPDVFDFGLSGHRGTVVDCRDLCCGRFDR